VFRAGLGAILGLGGPDMISGGDQAAARSM
jgi:hypothetical protein